MFQDRLKHKLKLKNEKNKELAKKADVKVGDLP